MIVENSTTNKNIITRLTILWAFSEAALGGILHAFKIPFTGLVIGGTATIFISLIAYFSESRNEIIKATIKVLLVKFVASPYSPLTAYFAVMLQGVLGNLLFYKGFNRISPILLGFLSLLLSAIQKIFILTLVFGVSLWESINIFFEFILAEVLGYTNASEYVDLSYVIIGAYILLHVLGGITAGIYALSMPSKIKIAISKKEELKLPSSKELIGKRKKRKKWWYRPSSLLLIIFSVVLISLSLMFENLGQGVAQKVVFMLLRSAIIIVVWFYLVSPVLLKFVKNILSKKLKFQADEVEKIINIFPNVRAIIKLSWTQSSTLKGTKRIVEFLSLVLINFLVLDFE
ncbi:MAG: hypothetical protein GY936_08635 [Ignavibacteriae bacterium]|nr:hypothetical protein [Ignavibacteriota bacterium]